MSITEYDTYQHKNSSKTEEPYIETASYSATQPAGFASNTTIDNGVFGTIDALVDERDAVAVQKVLAQQEGLRHSFSVKKHLENGDVENYLWTVCTSRYTELGYVACYRVLGGRYQAPGKNTAIEFEPQKHSFYGELTAADKAWTESLGRMAITSELYEGELDTHTYSIGTGANEVRPLNGPHDAQVVYLHDIDYLQLEDLFAEDAA